MSDIRRLLILVKSMDGGTGTYVESLRKVGKYLDDKNVTVQVICLEEPSFRHIDKNKIIFLRKKKYYPEEYHLAVRGAFDFIHEIIWVRKQLKRLNTKLVIGVDVHCNLLIQIGSMFLHRPPKTILTTHIDLKQTIEDKASRTLRSLLKWTIYYFYNKSDMVVCVSQGLAKALRKNYHLSVPTTYIYNGIPLKKYKSKKNNKHMTVISIARFTGQKDHMMLINAFMSVLKKSPNAQLLLLSDGALKSRLEKYVADSGWSDNIKITGWVKSIHPFLTNSDIFVHASKREGFGYVLVEAMAHKLPVIATDVPYGPSEILGKGEYGILIPKGDTKALTHAMYLLLSNLNAYHHFSKIAYTRSKYFSEEKMLREYAKLIQKVSED